MSNVKESFDRLVNDLRCDLRNSFHNRFPGYSVLHLIPSSPVTHLNDVHILCLAIHEIILEKGGVSGIDNSDDKFDSQKEWPNILPSSLGWNNGKTPLGDSFVFSYGNGERKQIATVKMTIMGGGNSVTVQVSNSSSSTSQTIYFGVKDYVSSGVKGIKPSMISRLEGVVSSQILPSIVSEHSSPVSLKIQSSAATSMPPFDEHHDLELKSAPRSQGAPPSLMIPGQRFPGGDFRGDLMPGGSAGSGDFSRDPIFSQGRYPGAGDGGMLMGPGHPMFTGGPGQQFLPPGVPPGARFDPFTPFTPSPALPFPGQTFENKKKKPKQPPHGGDFTTGDPDPDDFPPPGYTS